MTSRALAGLFPANAREGNLMVWSPVGYCARVERKDKFGCVS